MMVITSVQNTRMEITARRHSKRLEEMWKQRGWDIANIRRMPFRLNHRIRTPRQIHCHMRQRFIHRRKTISHADNSLAVAERLVEGLTQCQRNILHRVMNVNVQIALGLYSQIK